jgi:DNA-binding transcriptional LysR family regulator
VDLRWLEALAAVARLGSVSAAAESLHRSQPGVSRQLQKLEREVGERLLDRESGGVRLTEAGRRLLPHAEAALAAVAAMRRDAGERRVAGPLVVAASTTPGEFLVPELLAGFRAAHPAVEPFVIIADSAAVEADLLAGRREVGVVGERGAIGRLRYRAVAEDEVVLAVPADHRFAARERVRIEEVLAEPFVDREGGSGTVSSVRRILARHGLRSGTPNVVMTLGSGQAVVSAVERGYGVGWVSSLALAARRGGGVVPVRVEGTDLRRTLWLATVPDRPLSEPAAAFVAWVERRARPPARTRGAAAPRAPGERRRVSPDRYTNFG